MQAFSAVIELLIRGPPFGGMYFTVGPPQANPTPTIYAPSPHHSSFCRAHTRLNIIQIDHERKTKIDKPLSGKISEKSHSAAHSISPLSKQNKNTFAFQTAFRAVFTYMLLFGRRANGKKGSEKGAETNQFVNQTQTKTHDDMPVTPTWTGQTVFN